MELGLGLEEAFASYLPEPAPALLPKEPEEIRDLFERLASLENFRRKYCEPFNRKFPGCDLSEAPPTVLHLEFSSRPGRLGALPKPEILARLTYLKKLDILDRQADFFQEFNRIPPHIKERFEELNLSGSNIGNLDLDRIPGLKKLLLSRCRGFTAAKLNALPPKIKGGIAELDLSDLDLPDIADFDLEGFLYLKKLRLGLCRNFPIAKLNALPPALKQKIEELDLSGLDVTGLDLSGFTGLKILRLRSCRGFTAALLNTLPPAVKERIEELDLSGLDITGLDLSGFTGLKILRLERCRGFTAARLNTLPPAVKERIEELDLSGSDITGLDLKGFSRLKKLNLSGCPNFDPEMISKLPLPVQQKFEELNLSGLSLSRLDLRRCIRLKKLVLSNCSFPESRTLSPGARLLNALPKKAGTGEIPIEELDLGKTRITGLDLRPLTRIRKLNLEGCDGFNVDMLNSLQDAVKERIEELKIKPQQKKGLDGSRFILCENIYEPTPLGGISGIRP